MHEWVVCWALNEWVELSNCINKEKKNPDWELRSVMFCGVGAVVGHGSNNSILLN